MRDTTNEAIYFASTKDLFATEQRAGDHLDAATDLLGHATMRLAEARCYEEWSMFAYKSPPLRDKALDDHLAATDTLRAAVTELSAIVRQQSAEIVGLRELIEARDAEREGRAA